VTDVIGPGPNAKHMKTAYLPDHEHQEREVARIYQNSGRRTTYVGDWHTHSNGRLDLSRIDAATLKTISGHPPARLRHPVMTIISGRPGDWKMAPWRWIPKRVSILSRVVVLDIRSFESA
jgi:integrative and conjugative element protein (TIGR02256 family)